MPHLSSIFSSLRKLSGKSNDKISDKDFFKSLLKLIDQNQPLHLVEFLKASYQQFKEDPSVFKKKLNQLDEFGSTCLYLADIGNDQIFITLLAYGADPNIPRQNGGNASRYILERQIDKNNIEKIKALLLYGAEISFCNFPEGILLPYKDLISEKSSIGKQIRILQEHLEASLQSSSLHTDKTDSMQLVNYLKLGLLWLKEYQAAKNVCFRQHYYQQAAQAFTQVALSILENTDISDAHKKAFMEGSQILIHAHECLNQDSIASMTEANKKLEVCFLTSLKPN